MADCPGVLTLALMADGGLARLRVPGGSLTAVQAKAVADAAKRLGSGEIDLTNRANLQIRGLAPDGGPALAAALEPAGFRFEGEADRRRNILLDPFSGEDPEEQRDMRPLAAALDERLRAAPWIGLLSPKFSFVFDGCGDAGIAGTRSDVAVLGRSDRLTILTQLGAAWTVTDDQTLDVLISLAAAAAALGPDTRLPDVPRPAFDAALASASRVCVLEAPGRVRPSFGVSDGRDGRVCVSVPVAVGRLTADELGHLAAEAEREGRAELRLAPWSAVIIPGVAPDRAQGLLDRAAARGFPTVDVVRRLTVTACSGAPACERAREPAKDLAREILAAAARDADRLADRLSLHLCACPKGCARSGAADLLLLGNSEQSGWSIHHHGSPRHPGESFGRTDDPSPETVLALLDGVR